ncbi:MAG: efflux RND transporter periplasmic adaptor subunit [Cytophagaceae bacterium]
MKKSLYKIAIIIAASSLLYACGKSSDTSETEEHHEEEQGIVELTNAQFKSAGIQYGKVELKNLSSTITVNGILDAPPQNMASVSALMGGFIKSTDLLQGMKVKKGQIIATLQNPDFIQIQTQYLENVQKLKFLELEYKRQEELSKENVSSAKTFQQVSSDYYSLQATIGGLEEKLKIMNIDPSTLTRSSVRSIVNIYSPINGYVTTVNVNIGKFVNPQDIICEIVDTKHLHAELTVFEKDISKLKIGQKIRFVLVNENNKERTASIYLINHQISPERTVRVHAHIDQEDPNLMPNMYLKALIEVGEQKKTTALPEEAIVNIGEKFYIFIKDDEHGNEDTATHKETEEKHYDSTDIKHEEGQSFRVIEIQKGITQNGYTEVILPEGFETTHEEIVIKGAYALLSKMNNSEEEGHAH